jgi:hypothetical protein
VSAAFDELQAKHHVCTPSCIVPNCHSRDCTAHLPQGRSIGFACDRCNCFNGPEGQKKPDFVALLMGDADVALTWFVIEMKSRPSRPGDIAQQLQQGASIIERDDRFALPRPVTTLVPVLVKARGMKTTDVAALTASKVIFRGKKHPIRVENCGVRLFSIRAR